MYSCCLSTGHGAVIDLHDRLAVQMEKWDGVVLDVNATCANLGSTVCSKLLGAHAITGCDTVSYPFGKGKASMLKTMKEGDFPGLFDVLEEEGASHPIFVALYGQPSGSSMTQARYNLYTRKQGKPMHIMSLPPTDLNLFLHVKRAQLQMLKYYGRQPTSWVLRTFPSQNMAGRYKTGNLSKHL